MPIILRYVSGQERLIKGESFRELDQNTRALGQVEFVTHKDGNPFGECKGRAFKANIEEVIEVADADYQLASEKKAADLEAAQKAEASRKTKLAELQAKMVDNEAWKKRFFLARLLSKKPWPELG